jgi:hypothetical protein
LFLFLSPFIQSNHSMESVWSSGSFHLVFSI